MNVMSRKSNATKTENLENATMEQNVSEQPNMVTNQPKTNGVRRRLSEDEKAARRDESAYNFKRLANKRVPKLIKLMKHISNLGNKSVYFYTFEQRDKLFKLIDEAVTHMKASFETSEKQGSVDMF
jgi:hypothetical protein